MKISRKRLIEIIKEEVEGANKKESAANANQFGDALIKLGKQLKSGNVDNLDAIEIRATLAILTDLIKASATGNTASIMKQIVALVDKKIGQ